MGIPGNFDNIFETIFFSSELPFKGVFVSDEAEAQRHIGAEIPVEGIAGTNSNLLN